MNALKLVKLLGGVSLLAAVGYVNTAEAFTDCAGFPQTGAVNTPINTSGCQVTATHRGSANPRAVFVTMNTNTSGGSRRVLTVGLTGGAPIGPSCVAQDTSPAGGAQTNPAGGCNAAPVQSIRMHIQTN
jgi:hypothetical protein